MSKNKVLDIKINFKNIKNMLNKLLFHKIIKNSFLKLL